MIYAEFLLRDAIAVGREKRTDGTDNIGTFDLFLSDIQLFLGIHGNIAVSATIAVTLTSAPCVRRMVDGTS